MQVGVSEFRDTEAESGAECAVWRAAIRQPMPGVPRVAPTVSSGPEPGGAAAGHASLAHQKNLNGMRSFTLIASGGAPRIEEDVFFSICCNFTKLSQRCQKARLAVSFFVQVRAKR